MRPDSYHNFVLFIYLFNIVIVHEVPKKQENK